MASTLPQAATECCPPTCDATTSIQVPGPQGVAGSNGADGSDGVSPFTTFTSDFTIPAELATGVAAVADTSWMVLGQKLYGSRVDGSIHAFFEVAAIGGGTSVTLRNLESAASYAYLENSAPATVLNTGSKLGPAGIQGPSGLLVGAAGGHLKGNYPNPTIALNNTKGSLIVGNGTDSVAVAVSGTDGRLLRENSGDAEGVDWAKVLPHTGDTNAATQRVARLSATAGLPIPIEPSRAIINNPGVAAGEIGGFVLDVTGGNSRGTDAVDMQLNRSAGAAKIAGGSRNFIGAGQNNLTSGNDSSVVGGDTNTANGTRSFVGGGTSNAASGQDSTISGGSGNVATSAYSSVVGGELNEASGQGAAVGGGSQNEANTSYSSVPGGLYASATRYGEMAHASGRFSAVGDAQISEVLARRSTANATPAELFLDGASERISIASGRSVLFDIKLIARRADTGAGAIYTSVGLVQNIAGTTTAPSVTTTEVYDGASLPVTPVAVTADDANDALVITVTGIAATTIHWLAVVRLLEVG